MKKPGPSIRQFLHARPSGISWQPCQESLTAMIAAGTSAAALADDKFFKRFMADYTREVLRTNAAVPLPHSATLRQRLIPKFHLDMVDELKSTFPITKFALENVRIRSEYAESPPWNTYHPELPSPIPPILCHRFRRFRSCVQTTFLCILTYSTDRFGQFYAADSTHSNCANPVNSQ